MDDATRAAFVAALAPVGPSESFEEVPVTCPACGEFGLLLGAPEPNWEPDYDVEGSQGEPYMSGVYVSSIHVAGTSFACRVCGLSLDSTYLDAAGLGSLKLIEGEFDVDDATTYFGQQLADWPEW